MAEVKEPGDAGLAAGVPLVFAYYVTGHGLGHATRVVEVWALEWGWWCSASLSSFWIARWREFLRGSCSWCGVVWFAGGAALVSGGAWGSHCHGCAGVCVHAGHSVSQAAYSKRKSPSVASPWFFLSVPSPCKICVLNQTLNLLIPRGFLCRFRESIDPSECHFLGVPSGVAGLRSRAVGCSDGGLSGLTRAGLKPNAGFYVVWFDQRFPFPEERLW